MAETILEPAAPRLRDQHDYLRLLVARIAGTAAQQMLMVALGWQVYDLTASAWALGFVGLAQFLPALLFTLPAGHLVDKHDRRLMLAASLGLQALVAALLAWGSGGGWVDARWILATSVLLGMARAVQMPSIQALTPSLVPAKLLPRAVAASSSVMQGAIVLGPALGGALYGWAASHRESLPGAQPGAVVVYGTSLVLLLLSIGGALLVRHRSTHARTAAANWEASPPGCASSGTARSCWARSRSTSSRSCSVVRPRCCPSSPATSCRSAPKAWACCARRRRWGPYP
jgi:MFS family permease